VLAYLRGESDLARAIELVQQKSRNLAKHQMTWYRRWPDIRWLPGSAMDLHDQAQALVNKFLADPLTE
jgi:tRNA dimethylallyltransferase